MGLCIVGGGITIGLCVAFTVIRYKQRQVQTKIQILTKMRRDQASFDGQQLATERQPSSLPSYAEPERPTRMVNGYDMQQQLAYKKLI